MQLQADMDFLEICDMYHNLQA